MKTQSIYLDYAAATPLDEAALQALIPYQVNQFYNPSAAYEAARSVRRTVEAARATVANVLGAKDQEIIFTAGGSEANNLAIHGVLRAHPGSEVIVSAIEHESVLQPTENYSHQLTNVTSKGLVDLNELAGKVTDKTVLISIMYANNEIGTVQPLKKVVELVETVRKQRAEAGNALPLYIHTDACQASNYLDLHVSRLGIDLMTLNGGKIYGPKQSGALYVRTGVDLQSLVQGGGQERNLRSGTENVGSIIAFATMLQKVQNDRKRESNRVQLLRDQLFAKLSQNIPEIMLNGDKVHRLANNINMTVQGIEGERLLMELDEAGVMVATGSACAASSNKPSYVLRALGLSEAEASASLRITLGRQTTEDDMQHAATRIIETITSHRKLV